VLAVKLQEMFGQADTPTVAAEAVKDTGLPPLKIFLMFNNATQNERPKIRHGRS